ncbi:conserved membrane hypothetical protein [Hyella patelloides LEGE 07179]|uniref:DUF2029 domain-containing protein n=1 Tax=Hyella patelloides LEGE 07179 TaxID=945734 RepID=A0A563VZ21_9CYAN|nr:glycosyltransferase family 87 protein [Hyella patelloides]VEP16712.1 conserved membrane hypothetical protein [Hyella patelloides LEGE 07179]
MNQPPSKSSTGILQLPLKLWIRWHELILRISITVMAAAAVSRIGYGIARLLFLKGPNPAVDLMQRYTEVQLWFSGGHVYSQLTNGGVYPPASHVILWPFLIYPSWTFVRYLWAITSLVGLVWLIYLLLRASKAYNLQEKTFITLIGLTTYATNINIGNGQLTIHILASLVAGLVLIKRHSSAPSRWKSSLLAGFLIAVALVKPTVTAPFFLIPMFVPRGWLVAVFAGIIYILFALIATAFQDSNIIDLHLDWLERGVSGTVVGSTAEPNMLVGYGDIHNLLNSIGLSEFNFEFSMLILLIFGIWLYFHRYVDLWLLIGITALISRFWAYHRVYDDLVIILPMVTLFRLAKQTTMDRTARTLSGIVLAIATCSILVPDRLRLLNPPWDLLFKGGQVTVWFLMLGFLVFQAFVQRNKIIGVADLSNVTQNNTVRSYKL